MRKHLIIGCGPAALSAARAIRSAAPEDTVRLVTDEPYPPYSRMVLPYMLSGQASAAGTWKGSARLLRQIGCTADRNKEVIRVQPHTKEVVFKDGASETYDTLLIASGAEPVRPPIRGLDRVGFLGFHTLDDCKRLLAQLGDRDGGKRAVVYGGGLVSLQLAVALAGRGCAVTMVMRTWPLRRYVDREIGEMVLDILKSQRVQVAASTEVKLVDRAHPGVKVELSDGTCVRADVFVCGTGVIPKISFLRGTSLKTGLGVLVDRTMRTSCDGVFAAGDIAEAPAFFTGERGTNPILPTAVEQGRVAGNNMVGRLMGYRGWIPVNVFSFFGNVLFSAGLSTESPGGGTLILEERDRSKRQYKKLVFKGDRLVGVTFLNIETDPGAIVYLMEHSMPVGQHKEVLFERPQEASLWLVRERERMESLGAEKRNP